MPPAHFEKLHQAYARELFAYLWRLFDGGPEAEDCLQETFLRALRAYPRLHSHRNLRAWLYRIATNTARSYLRRRSRERNLTADLHYDRPQPAPSASDSYDQQQTLAAVRSAIRALPHKQQTALLLRRYQGLPYAEIARVLQCSPAAARANVYQALSRLRRQFASLKEMDRRRS